MPTAAPRLIYPATDERRTTPTARLRDVHPRLPSTAAADLSASQSAIFVRGRWVLFGAELIALGLRIADVEKSVPAELVAGLLVLYNIGSLWLLRRLPPARVPAVPFLVADVLVVGWLAALTGGILSPFSGLFYLITLVGAVYYDLRGSVAVALAAAAIMLVGSARTPELWVRVFDEHQRSQFLPFLLMHAVVAGYLVRYLKRLHERRIEFEERFQRARYEAERREGEERLAREFQLAALTPPPRQPFFDLCVRFEPAREVGGDFYAFCGSGRRFLTRRWLSSQLRPKNPTARRQSRRPRASYHGSGPRLRRSCHADRRTGIDFPRN